MICSAVGVLALPFPVVPTHEGHFCGREPIKAEEREHFVEGVVEAKPDSWGAKITTVEEQSSGYAAAQLKWVSNQDPLRFHLRGNGCPHAVYRRARSEAALS
jgi:hypothetical protein